MSVIRRMDNASRIAAQSKTGEEGKGSLSDASDPEQMRTAMRAMMGRAG